MLGSCLQARVFELYASPEDIAREKARFAPESSAQQGSTSSKLATSVSAALAAPSLAMASLQSNLNQLSSDRVQTTAAGTSTTYSGDISRGQRRGDGGVAGPSPHSAGRQVVERGQAFVSMLRPPIGSIVSDGSCSEPDSDAGSSLWDTAYRSQLEDALIAWGRMQRDASRPLRRGWWAQPAAAGKLPGWLSEGALQVGGGGVSGRKRRHREDVGTCAGEVGQAETACGVSDYSWLSASQFKLPWLL